MGSERSEFLRLYLSSWAISLVSRLAAVGGDEEGPGEIDFWREDLLELREGVLYGVSFGVGREAAAAAAYSSSVSQAVMMPEETIYRNQETSIARIHPTCTALVISTTKL